MGLFLQQILITSVLEYFNNSIVGMLPTFFVAMAAKFLVTKRPTFYS